MKALLNQLALDRNLSAAHYRVVLFVLANGPNADLAALPWSSQTINQAAGYCVNRGFIQHDSGRSTFSLVNSEMESEIEPSPAKPEATETQPVEPVPMIPEKQVEQKDGFEWHPFLRRSWEYEQKPALNAWFKSGLKRDLCRIAKATTCADPVWASSNPDFKEALDWAEKWALKVTALR